MLPGSSTDPIEPQARLSSPTSSKVFASAIMSSIDSFYPLLPPRYSLRPRRSRPSKPNYNQLHSKPLPLDTFPLPPLIPQNPISILHIAYTFLSHLFFPPSSHPRPRIRGHYSTSTRSVHVTDSESVRLLWERGFFGKGSLSRSEPTWLDREMRRQGLGDTETSENATAARREERKRFKMERARKEQEAIDEKLMEELLVDSIAKAQRSEGQGPCKPTLRSKYEGLADAALLSPSDQTFFDPANVRHARSPAQESASKNKPANSSAIAKADFLPSAQDPDPTILTRAALTNQEHLQLTPEEAFFLTFALGVLDIYPDATIPNTPTSQPGSADTPLPPSTLFQQFLSHASNFLSASSNATSHSLTSFDTSNPFLLNYVTYHHFRSLGWVVRPGQKFGVDWLLYVRGPVFSHAEFAVVVQPALRVNINASEENEQNIRKGWDWHHFHCLQRVQSQVRKTLVIAWVEFPLASALHEFSSPSFLSPSPEKTTADAVSDAANDIPSLLKKYKVREMIFRRWTPNRSRD